MSREPSSRTSSSLRSMSEVTRTSISSFETRILKSLNESLNARNGSPRVDPHGWKRPTVFSRRSLLFLKPWPRQRLQPHRSSRSESRGDALPLPPFHVSVLRLSAGGRAPEERLDPFLCYLPVSGIEHLGLIRRVTAGCDYEKACEGNNDSARRRKRTVV